MIQWLIAFENIPIAHSYDVRMYFLKTVCPKDNIRQWIWRFK